MNKNFLVLLTVLLISASALGLSSKKILSKYMEIPEAAETYNYAQIEKIGTVLDYKMFKFFNFEDPVISQVTPALKAALSNQMRLQLASDRMKNTLVTAATNKRVFEMVSESMRNLGFSESQIKKAKIYLALGAPNAYTYGFDKDNVVIVIYDELLKRLSKQEMQAVISHELGHVVAQHILAGVQLNLMLSRIVQIAMSSNPGAGSQGLAVADQKLVEDFLEKNLAQNLTKFSGLSEEEAVRAVKTTLAPPSLSTRIKIMESKLPMETILASSQEFLFEVVRGMERMEIPQSTKDFFSQLAYDLPTAYRPNVEDLLKNLGVLSRALQRESEMTADLMAVSAIDPYVATRVEMRLSGGAGLSNKPTRSEVQAAIDTQRSEVDAAVEGTTKEEIALLLGTHGSDHPENNIRSVNQVILSRQYKIIAMRNPFLRLVMLRDKLDIKHQYLLDQIKLVSPQQNEPLAKAAQRTKELVDALTADIVALVSELGFDKVNPRLNDYLEYRLNDREFNLALIQRLVKMKQDFANDRVQTEYFEQQIQKIKSTLEKTNTLTQAIKEKATDKSEKVFARLFTVDSQPDVATIQDLRNQIRTEEKSLNRESRADMNVSVNVHKGSGIITSAKHMPETRPQPARPVLMGMNCNTALSNLIKKAK